MNKKIKNYLKVGTLLFGVFLFLWNCEKEEISHIEQVLSIEKFHSRRISGSEIPNIIGLINKETKNVLTTKSSSSTNYGELDIEDIVEVIDTIGNTNYSFRISNIDDDGLSVYNLVVHTDDDGNTNTPYVVKYTMEEDFANAYYTNTKDFGEFTGTISRYTIDAFLSSHSTKYAKDTPILDCPCDETSVENGGTNTGGTGNSGSGSNDPDGDTTSGTGDGTSSGGGGFSACTLIIVVSPCSCPGHHTNACGCAILYGGTNASYAFEYDCSAKSFQQKGSDDCPQDTNGNCPEDDGYVGVNTNLEFFDEQVFIDDDFKNNECLKSVYDSLGKASTFQGYLQNFEPEFSVAHLRFGYDENFKNNREPEYWGALAITEPPLGNQDNVANYNINITFNGDTNLEASIHNKPKLVIAVAFIHEMIHAEVFRKMLSAAQQGHLNIDLYTTQNRIDYVISLRDNFEGIYDYYVERWKPDWGHEQMAQHYRNVIVSVISEYDNNQHTPEVYEALAWIGLENTIAWNNLTQPEKDNITQTRTNFIDNDTSKCD